jgi:hypothetical protein
MEKFLIIVSLVAKNKNFLGANFLLEKMTKFAPKEKPGESEAKVGNPWEVKLKQAAFPGLHTYIHTYIHAMSVAMFHLVIHP